MRARIATGLAVSFSLSLAGSGCGRSVSGPLGESTTTTKLAGEGASVPAPLYARWVTEYAPVDPQTSVTYTSSNSGKGIEAITGKRVDFGASDFPLPEESRGGAKLIEIPTTVGAIVLSYRLSLSKPLILTPQILAGIYTATIKLWDDPAIVAANPGVALPPRQIRVLYRDGSSGTSSILTTYLSRAAPRQWVEAPTLTFKPKGGIAVKGSEGVIAAVKDTEGALGYVDYSEAVTQKLQMAALVNKDGEAILPSLETISNAVAAEPRDDLRDQPVNARGLKSYPMASLSYVIAPLAIANRATGVALARFLWWATHDGQKFGPRLGFAPLPEEVVVRVESLLRSMTAGGDPSLSGS